MMGFMQVTSQVMVDAAVVMKRVREDSDAIHSTFQKEGGPSIVLHHAIKGIHNELFRLNIALASIPAMAGEMNVMNRQMSVMAHGVGSTMGRMGNMLPW